MIKTMYIGLVVDVLEDRSDCIVSGYTPNLTHLQHFLFTRYKLYKPVNAWLFISKCQDGKLESIEERKL